MPIMGLPGKPKVFDGSEVERYFREGKIEEFADYCETDVVGTYKVWLRDERPPTPMPVSFLNACWLMPGARDATA
jgi:hypothetical protein